MNKHFFIFSFKLLSTISMVVISAFVVWELYGYYHFLPQTRDGKIRAEIVQLATDVSGRIETIHVHDNQLVKTGELLFSLDKTRFLNDVTQAQANLKLSQATLQTAEREYKRYSKLNDLVSAQQRDDKRDAVLLAQANLESANAELELAQINLNSADVFSPVDGVVTNFSLRPGSYASTGTPVMALIDQKSFYVLGYFEETKLSRIRNGAKATISVMGETQPIYGHVEGLSAGINDSELTTSSGTMLANVNPTFSWIRLAQRIPVRIKIDTVPPGVNLIAGRTVSVTLEEIE
ncbi:HlyD family secretion protein [Shewanella mangrovisoli]|uniref:HlyD family secretion protein n=1 Tax=Shewanella mangrovisoli TaxID=2864211 RepID=UPI00370C8AF5